MKTTNRSRKSLCTIFPCVIFLFSCFTDIHSIPYVGTIEFPVGMSNSEWPGVYCNGFSIPVEVYTHPSTVASFEIESEQSKDTSCFSLLFVAEAIDPTCHDAQRGIPACLNVPAPVAYRYVELVQTEVVGDVQSPEEKSDVHMMTWKINDKKLENGHVPERSVIILIDPSLVILENVQWDILDNFISLPKINIKHEKDLVERMVRLQFAKVKMNGIHERLRPKMDIRLRPSGVTVCKKSQCL